DRIAAVGADARQNADDVRVVDVRGMTLMPGLIDCHVHVTAVAADLSAMAEWSPFYVAARSAEVLKGMLDRGFTTVRDAAGADWGIAQAIDEGFLIGPRVLFGGNALSQSGGHGDVRSRGRMSVPESASNMSSVCDGVDEVRRAVRHELRRGAHHIKLMLSGGVASPTDRVDSTQFSLDEIRAAVEEATAANRYVLGHAYTSRAIDRGLECGVRSIEHGNLMQDSSIGLFLKHHAFYVPTLVTYWALAEHGKAAGLPQASFEKVFDVLDAGRGALERAYRGGVPIAFGTDLLGAMHQYQSREFRIRSEVMPPIEVIRSATSVAARLVCMEGQIGTLSPGAYADLLVVDGNPLSDIGVLAEPESHLKLVMKAGQVCRECV
ncbi:MAG: amidohydrolase family protein, partial [Chloroflexi bacterium]|nr:amidohydrolase family protein [Chloroflexota bacterium]